MRDKNVCFIGHRKIKVTKSLTDRLVLLIYKLINNGFFNFIFGSHSQFNDLCYQIVTNLQKHYPLIRRIHYCLTYENYTNVGIKNLYEQEIDCELAMTAGKSSYIIRNQTLIDNSDICVFYYDENYKPPRRKNSKNDLFDFQPKSGTAIVFQYAKRKNKVIVNLKELMNNLNKKKSTPDESGVLF